MHYTYDNCRNVGILLTNMNNRDIFHSMYTFVYGVLRVGRVRARELSYTVYFVRIRNTNRSIEQNQLSDFQFTIHKTQQ